jgi:hypothetical protein
MGDTLVGSSARLTARLIGVADDAPEHTLQLIRDVEVVEEAQVTDPDQPFSFDAAAPARYRLQLMRGAVIVALTSPIYLERAPIPPPGPLPVVPRS